MSLPPWTVFVVQHSHIDLGFTDRQEAIAGFHRRFLGQALALAEADAGRPEDARFKFTCEGFWAVEQFLAGCGPEERGRFIGAVRGGAIELTAFYLHLTELLDLGHLRDTLTPAREFARENGLPLTCAMSCDVNGLSWGMADALAEGGVRFLSSNINQHHGGYPNGGPLNAFHWEGPDGGRVLVWNGLAYHKANLLGLMGGWNPVGSAGLPGAPPDAGGGEFVQVADIGAAERLLPPVLDGLEAGGYPYRFLPLMGSGLYTDNSPPTDRHCRLIAQWNARHGDRVRIKTATLADFFAHLEKEAGALPVFRGDWPDWWSDGAASAPVDTLLFRSAQRAKRLAERLDPGGRVMTAPVRAAISRKLCLYAEHTFGYSDTSSPALLSQQVFRRKTKLAVDADEAACAALDGVLRLRGAGAFTADRRFTYAVLNAGAVPLHGPAALPVDSWETPLFGGAFSVCDSAGRVFPHQVVADSRGWKVYVSLELAAGEERALTLVPGRADGLPPGKTWHTEAARGGLYENAFLRAGWSESAGITSLVDKESGLELLGRALGRGLGAPVYQVFPGGSRWGAGGFNGAPRRIPEAVVHEGACRSCRVTAGGPVFTAVTAEYAVAGTRRYSVEARFAHDSRRVDVAVRAEKTSERDPEGLYAAFPLAVPGGTWHLDKPGGLVRPGVDQIPGTCGDYFLVQDGAACTGARAGVAWTTLDAPLVQVGGLRLWQFGVAAGRPLGTGGALYSWLTNNKWECNFPVDCGGSFEFRYSLEAGVLLAGPEIAAARLRANASPLTVIRTG